MPWNRPPCGPGDGPAGPGVHSSVAGRRCSHGRSLPSRSMSWPGGPRRDLEKVASHLCRQCPCLRVCLLRAFAAVLPMNPAGGWLSGKAKRPAVRVGSHHGGQRPRWRHAAKCVSRERNRESAANHKGKDHEPRERPATTASRPWHAREGGPSARTSLGSPCAVPVQLSLGSASGPARSGLTMNALTEVPWRAGKPG